MVELWFKVCGSWVCKTVNASNGPSLVARVELMEVLYGPVVDTVWY
jgi:hypothetical protein